MSTKGNMCLSSDFRAVLTYVITPIVLLTMLGAGPLRAQEVKVYVSSAAGDRLAAQEPARFEAKSKARDEQMASFQIHEAEKRQTIMGFGASFLEAGMVCLNSLTTPNQEAVLRALFDPEKGAGFTAMKSPIAATDFMSAGPWYSYNDTAGDVEMKNFSIARDLGPNGLVTYIKRARKYGKFIIQSPMDYPPDWMLFDVNGNQDVNPKYFHALAMYYLRFVQEYEKNGVFIDYLSLFNEPFAYTKIPYTKIRDLLKDHVGPLFANNGVKTQLQLSEDPFRAGAYKNYPVILDDPQARRYVSSLPYHGYDFIQFKKPPTRENGYKFEEYDKLAELHRRYPELPLWMTEVCYWTLGTPWGKPIPRYDFENGDFWENMIISDLESGASAWTYWNMVLDQNGGPWLVSPVHNDPPDNVQHPVVIINRDTKKVSYTGLYYYLAHFSKFVRPGSVRIRTSGTADEVRLVAFQRPDGLFVAELINSRKSDVRVRLGWRGKSLERTLPAISITTLLWKGI